MCEVVFLMVIWWVLCSVVYILWCLWSMGVMGVIDVCGGYYIVVCKIW